MSALLLSADDVQAHLSPDDCLAAVDAAFRASRAGAAHAPAPMHLDGEGGGLHAKGAVMRISEALYAAVKVNANFPGNPERNGLPTVQGVVVLSDARNGALLALIDSGALTALRTAAASALAARHLARRDAGVLAIIGCGAQAAPHVTAIAAVRQISRGFAVDRDAGRARQFAERMTTIYGFDFEPMATAVEAARQSDIIVTSTSATAPILGVGDVSPGAFIAAVGADHPYKNEIEPALMAAARVVADSLPQCLAMGDLHHAIAAGAMAAGDIHGELADVLTGAREGRSRDDEIFVFDSTGSALQDVAAAAVLYERAVARPHAAFDFARQPTV